MYKLGFICASMYWGIAIAKSNCPLPQDLDPVCGSDGQTYENICTLVRARSLESNLELLSEGPCAEDNPQEEEEEQDPESQEKPTCDCPHDTVLVCVNDGNSYDNACMVDCARIENPLSVKVKAKACEEKTKAVQKRDQNCECPLEKMQVGDEVGMDKSAMCCGPVLFPENK